MVNDVVIHEEDLLDFGAILDVYRQVSLMYSVPPLSDLYGYYQQMIDIKVYELQANLYPDDIYDGTPGRKAIRCLPDSMRADLGMHIGMKEDLTMYELKNLLDRFFMTYYDENEIKNPPVKEIW